MKATTIFGLVSRLGAAVDVRDRSGHVYAYAIDDLDDTLEDPTIDIGHLGTACGTTVYVERGTDQLAAVAVVEASTAEAISSHRDGGELVRKLYGHPDARLARDRVREAFQQAPPTPAPLVAAGR